MFDYMQMDSTKLIQTEEITEKGQYTIKFAFFFIFIKGEKKNCMVYYVMKHEDRNSTLITTYDP